MKLHHIEIHHNEEKEVGEPGEHRVSHHFIAEENEHPTHVEHHYMEAHEVPPHISQTMAEYAEPQETPEDEAAQPKPGAKAKQIKEQEHHTSHNPMGIGRQAPVRQY